jgi:hypothetical protein
LTGVGGCESAAKLDPRAMQAHLHRAGGRVDRVSYLLDAQSEEVVQTDNLPALAAERLHGFQ